MRQHWIGIVAATLLIAGCQTWGPTWSEVTGDRYTRVTPDRREANIVWVGTQWVGSANPFKVMPGEYDIVVESPVHNRFRGSQQTIRLTLEPCKRYYLNAQFTNSVGPDWTPVVDFVDTIPGCRVPAP